MVPAALTVQENISGVERPLHESLLLGEYKMGSRNFVATVKETGDGVPWLLVELHEEIGVTQDSHITMTLPNGADIEEARRVANLLNDNITGFRVKRF